jgi:hypothetical protein
MASEKSTELEVTSDLRSGRRRLLDWLCAGRADYRDHQERKCRSIHRRRRDLCRWLWIGTGCLILLQPTLQIMIIGALTSTFLSFALLDECSSDNGE